MPGFSIDSVCRTEAGKDSLHSVAGRCSDDVGRGISVMASFNFALLRSKSSGTLSADIGSTCMSLSCHPTRNKATSRGLDLSPDLYAPLPYSLDIPIVVRRECPPAYRGIRPGIHSRHGCFVLPSVGETAENRAFCSTCHIYDSQALARHPLSVCSLGSHSINCVGWYT